MLDNNRNRFKKLLEKSRKSNAKKRRLARGNFRTNQIVKLRRKGDKRCKNSRDLKLTEMKIVAKKPNSADSSKLRIATLTSSVVKPNQFHLIMSALMAMTTYTREERKILPISNSKTKGNLEVVEDPQMLIRLHQELK